MTRGIGAQTNQIPVLGITPAAAAVGDSLFSSVSLLCHFDGTDGSTTFTDSSNNGLSLTAVGDAQLDTAQSKFGTASLLTDGTGDRVTLPNNAVLNLTGDFCIEMFVRITTSSATGTILELGGNGTGFAAQAIQWSNSAGELRFFSSANGSTFGIANGLTIGTVTNNTWHYVKVSRSGNNYNFLFDGALTTVLNDSSTPMSGTGHLIGDDGSNSTPFAGHIDELRITKGESRLGIAPTAAFPDSA